MDMAPKTQAIKGENIYIYKHRLDLIKQKVLSCKVCSQENETHRVRENILNPMPGKSTVQNM